MKQDDVREIDWEKNKIAYKIVGIVRGWDMANHQNPDEIFDLITGELLTFQRSHSTSLLQKIERLKEEWEIKTDYRLGYRDALSDCIAIVKENV